MEAHKGNPAHSNPQPSQGVNADASQHASTTSQHSLIGLSMKKEPLANAADSNPGSVTTLHSPAQAYPKKKGGFVITSVKDNVDGDESADDLDESHTSYSEVSYSRTPDVDHDQESSASEDTLNMTQQDGMQQLASSQSSLGAGFIPNSADAKNTASNSVKGSLDLNQEHITEKKNDATPIGNHASIPNLTPVAPPKDSIPTELATSTTLPQAMSSNGVQVSSYKNVTKTVAASGGANTVVTQSTSNTVAVKAATSGSESKSGASVGQQTTGVTTSKTSSATSGTVTKASRVYKVVKRETFQPVKRERSRWICCDYMDTQSPSIGFVLHSSSDSRLNYHEQQHHLPNTIPMSMSATSVQSSASSYSLQHSDSSSSVYRDSHPIATPAVQHSASTSSVNHDLENRKTQRATSVKAVGDSVEDVMRRQSLEEKAVLTDPEAIKSAILRSVDATASEDDSTSSRTFRIDNKIEAAMDLVKKHLMLAVRDEVDELKEKIVELQDDNMKMKRENDVLKGLLTSEQLTTAQQFLNMQQTKSHPLQKSASMQQSQGSSIGTVSGYNMPLQNSHDVPLANQSLLHQTLAQNSSVSINSHLAQGYALQQQPASNQAGNMQMQQIPTNTNAMMSQGNTQPVHPQQVTLPASQQQQHHMMQMSMPGQSASQQQQPSGSVRQPAPATFQPQQHVFPTLPQLTPQQIQAIRQQGYPPNQSSASGQAATVQSPFPAPVAMQSTVTNQPSSFQPIQTHYQNQQPQPSSYAPPIQSHSTYQQQAAGVVPPLTGVQQSTLVLSRPQQSANGLSGVTSPTNSVPPTHPNTYHIHQSVTPTHATGTGSAHSNIAQQASLPHSVVSQPSQPV